MSYALILWESDEEQKTWDVVHRRMIEGSFDAGQDVTAQYSDGLSYPAKVQFHFI